MTSYFKMTTVQEKAMYTLFVFQNKVVTEFNMETIHLQIMLHDVD
jgi:hypothetical protein